MATEAREIRLRGYVSDFLETKWPAEDSSYTVVRYANGELAVRYGKNGEDAVTKFYSRGGVAELDPSTEEADEQAEEAPQPSAEATPVPDVNVTTSDD